MGSKALKQFLKQSSALDDLIQLQTQKSTKDKKIKGIQKKAPDQVPKSPLQSQIDSYLFFDKAFSNRTSTVNEALDDTLKKLQMEKKNRTKAIEIRKEVGNTRSSSSKFIRKASIPTFNKKKDEEQKKIKSLKDLARRLKKDIKK